MASLLNKTTAGQLGISANVGAFADSVIGKKKVAKVKTAAEQTQDSATNAAGDSRLAAQANVQNSYDPKADNAANLMLTTDDQAFINMVQTMKTDLFAGNYEGGGGIKADTAGFFKIADASSRGGMGDIWNDVMALATKGSMGPKALARTQEAFTKAYEKTSQYINLDVDQGRYNFDPGTGDGVYGKAIKGEKPVQVKGDTAGNMARKAVKKAGNDAFTEAYQSGKAQAKANQGVSASANGSFAWDLGADLAKKGLSIR